MARETLSTLIELSISASRIWCDGSEGRLESSYADTVNIDMRKRLQWSCGGRAMLLIELMNRRTMIWFEIRMRAWDT